MDHFDEALYPVATPDSSSTDLLSSLELDVLRLDKSSYKTNDQ